MQSFVRSNPELQRRLGWMPPASDLETRKPGELWLVQVHRRLLTDNDAGYVKLVPRKYRVAQNWEVIWQIEGIEMISTFVDNFHAQVHAAHTKS